MAGLTQRLERRGRFLLNQQCWLWGQDCKRPEGNLLLAYGFERERAAEGQASSQYTLRLASAATIGDESPAANRPCRVACETTAGLSLRLWGFGLAVGDEHAALYLNRFNFQPCAATLLPRHTTAQEMQKLERAEDLTLLPVALDGLAAYESWVLWRYGVGYRRACLATWARRQLPPEQMPQAWSDLAAEVRALCERGVEARMPHRSQSSSRKSGRRPTSALHETKRAKSRAKPTTIAM